MSLSGRTICVVGAGPRGLAVLERLCANHRGPGRVHVHVVDPYPPGPGRVWRTRQSEHLLMNTVTSQVSQFTDESIACAGPVRPGPSLYEWARSADPGGALGPDAYPSRARCGQYLDWVFQHVRATAPAGVTIEVHSATAVALADDGGKQVLTLDSGARITGLDAVVLALGHGPTALGPDEAAMRAHAQADDLRYLPPGNPADADLTGIGAGERIAVRGLGLVFFDYLSLLTEGRGGTFARCGPGLRYLPSGDEPVIFAGSRRGVPHHARGENQKGATGRHEPRFLTPAAIARLRADPATTFRRDVWPLISAEVQDVYYAAIIADRRGAAAADRFRAAFAERAEADRADLLRAHGIAAHEEWDWDRVERPHGATRFPGRPAFTSWLLAHLRADLAHARRGNVGDPLKAALDVLRDLRNEIRQVVDHGGIRGASYRDDVLRWYSPLNAHLSIGPPLSRVEEMIALVEAGVLRVTGPGTRVRRAPGGPFLIGATGVADHEVPVRTLVDARVPDIDLRRSENPLLRRLLAEGQCRPYLVPDPDGDVETGGLAVTTRPYRLVRADGSAHPARFAYGVPTESVHWATAAGIRPGVGSVTLEDADAIARAALAVG